MRKNRVIFLLWLLMLFLCCQNVSAKTAIITDGSGDGSLFGKVDTVYYKLTSDCHFCLGINAVYGFSNETKLKSFWNSCSKSEADDGRKTWNRRYAYILCDKNKKIIDPVGWHKPGKKSYRYQYYLKKGTYYLKIKTEKRNCGLYFIHGTYYPQADEKSIANNSPGGPRKSKATKLKTPDGSDYYTNAALTNAYSWNGNYYAFPYMGSDKNAQAWFKFYSDGSKPVYVVARADSFVGKWEMTVYGPSCGNGRIKRFPGSIVVNNKGVVELHKNGKKIDRINTFTIARKDSTGEVVGPEAGWYYVKVSKHKTAGKNAEYYKRMSLLGDIFVTTNAAFESLRY